MYTEMTPTTLCWFTVKNTKKRRRRKEKVRLQPNKYAHLHLQRKVLLVILIKKYNSNGLVHICFLHLHLKRSPDEEII